MASTEPHRTASQVAGDRSISGALLSATAYGINIDAFLAPDFHLKKWVNDALALPYAAFRAQRNVYTGDSAGSSIAAEKEDDPSEDPLARSRQGSLVALPTKSKGSNGEVTSLDQVASGLVLKLQLLSLDVSNKFEQLSDEAVRNMPRALYDLELIRKDAQKVNEAIIEGKRDFDRAERGGGGAFKDLVKLDLVRNRMVATRLALKEAENWSTLAGEINAIFAAEDFEKASIRLEDAERSLNLLSATPDFAERKALLAELQTNLQETIEPRVVAVLNDHDAEATKKLYRVFARIQRTSDFIKHYHTSQISPLSRYWQDYDEVATVRAAQAGNDEELAEWLTQFYDEILRTINKELPWSAYIFPAPKQIMYDMLQALFSSLQPSFGSRIRTLAEGMGHESLLSIVMAYQATVQFGIKFERLLIFADASRAPSSPIREDFERDLPSSNSSTTFTMNYTNDEISKWGVVPFEMFLTFQQRYGQLERNYLLSLASSMLALGRNADYMEITRVMGDSVSKVFGYGEAAVARCRQFTNAFGAADLVGALDEYFTNVFGRYNTILQSLRGEVGLSSTEHKGSDEDDGYEFGSGELGRQEWGNFQVGLKVLGLCTVLQKRLEGFDRFVARALMPVLRWSMDPNWRTPIDFYSSEEKGHPEACLGSLAILRTSTLNSFELRNTYDSMASVAHPESSQHITHVGSNISLFRKAPSRLRGFAIEAQRFVYDTLFEIVDTQLATVPALTTWNTNAQTTAGPFNLDVPQFSLSPLSYVTRIGEHLLTLPQQLDLYVEDEALKCSIETLPFLSDETADVDPVEQAVAAEFNPSTPVPASASNLGSPQNEDANEDLDEDDDVTYLWIKSISRGTMGRYVQAILQIPRLTPDGAKQLATDVRYLGNVFDALDVDRALLYVKLLEVLEMTTGDLADLHRTNTSAAPGTISAGERQLIDKVYKMRMGAPARYP
ncbi:hypothetical protein PhCBS80983_g02928 [Powellomyces hirtus]|uniref:Conserved oligomeric Golgi complex subunit 7 n=1 Tax=Powellomyces hirtus TaxID=109895 RepID=A0A507E3Q8_9FUNG|nr:hypothetical protein PhCBS80983_g02928 [Powellomyces hirtus]